MRSVVVVCSSTTSAVAADPFARSAAVRAFDLDGTASPELAVV
jgi:hypothetical protein